MSKNNYLFTANKTGAITSKFSDDHYIGVCTCPICEDWYAKDCEYDNEYGGCIHANGSYGYLMECPYCDSLYLNTQRLLIRPINERGILNWFRRLFN